MRLSDDKIVENDKNANPSQMKTRSRSWIASISSKVLAYLELIRPHNVIAAVLCTFVGMVASSRTISYPISAVDAAAAALVVASVSASGYAINDYFDYKVDLVNKPYRPIPSGRVGLREAVVFSVVLGIVGLALSTWFGLLSITFVLANYVLVLLYSAKIKESGFFGNIVVSLEGAATIVYGSLVISLRTGCYDALAASVTPAVIAFALLLGREVVKTIEDYYADAVRNVRSLPRTLGLQRSAYIAAAILLSIVPLSALPLLSGIYNRLTYAPLAALTVVLVIMSAVKILRSPNPVSTAIKVRSVLKVAIVTGILALLLSLVIWPT